MIGGIVVTNNNTIAEEIAFLQNSIGAIQGPFDAFLALKRFKNIAFRIRQT